MERRLFSDLAISLFLNLLIKPISILFIDAGVQKAVGNEAYGGYFVLFNLTVILNIFLDLGINNYTVRYIAQKQKNMSDFISRIYSLKLILFLIYILLVCCVGALMKISPDAFRHLLILILIQFIIQFIAFNRAVLNGQHRFRKEALVSVTDRVILILLVGTQLFYFPNNISIEGFIYAQLISYSIALALSFFLLKDNLFMSEQKILGGISLKLLKQTLPYALLILLMLIYNRIDSILLQQLVNDGDYQAGVYAQGFRLLDALYMVGMIFVGILFPVFSRMIHEKNLELTSLIQATAKILIGGSIILAFVSILNAKFFLSFIYGDTISQDSLFVFQCLMISFACMSVNFLFGTLLTATANFKSLIFSASVGVITTTLLNGIFIPIYGVKSCAVVSIITQALVSYLLYISSVRTLRTGLSMETKKYLTMMICLLSVFIGMIFPLKDGVFSLIIVLLIGLDFYIPIMFEELGRNKKILNNKLTLVD